jgi:predicted DNA-binding ribbon-helix-helix protein
MKPLVVRHGVYVAGHKTSVSVEDEFWKELIVIAKERRVSASDLVTSINADRRHSNLSSAVRLFVLNHYRTQIAEHRGRKRSA